ncbi:SRPBCC family protein [Ancylobacter defluvii]|uniref:MxaD protein n=1 Tax=Ancylobacter defluvii TaxID=1282440 RepID=A0A9W6JY71_9HYPH|nr:SRPBCC family protein [Ancylobacter defluvii]MBS7586766.1 SRPBCC family protein [Ancylobacter defluvii]GLK86070.1 hypothetical protein GCM10017653_41400 [Ancylobacter defluvii]
MFERLMLAFAFVLMGLAPLAAHGPTPQRAEERVTIAAAPDKVWALLARFGGIGDWNPLVKKVSVTGGDAAGAERVLTLEKGEIAEGLDEVDPTARRLSYRLLKENVEAFPVSFYTATIEVKPSGSGSEVVWDARFYRADTTNEPPEGLDDAAAIAAMGDFIRQGLEGLKSQANGQ